MRLVAQVQRPLQQRLLTGYDKLSQDDKDVQSSEMALTGCTKQDYACNKIQQGGPVFLVYYSPAFLHVAPFGCCLRPTYARGGLSPRARFGPLIRTSTMNM